MLTVRSCAGFVGALMLSQTINMSATSAADSADSHFGLTSDSVVDFGLSKGGVTARAPRPEQTGASRASTSRGANSSLYRVLENGCSVAVNGAEVALNPMIACLSYTPDGGPDTAPQVVDAGTLARRAVGQLNLPKPRVATAPATRAAVGLPTWLWVDRSQWQPLSESISVPGATLRISAQPTTAIWNMGEGVKTCTNPGRPWQKGLNPAAGCTYQYQRTSKNQPGGAYSTAMRVQYSITWACSGNCSEGGGELGTLDSPATTKQLPVVELVPVLTR